MIYLDNAATTYPKPEEVYQKIDWANRNIAINAGRGSYKAAQEASRLIEETRRQLIELVHGLGNEHAVLLPSATIALNVILNGLSFSDGDVIYVSPYEHNAVSQCGQLKPRTLIFQYFWAYILHFFTKIS